METDVCKVCLVLMSSSSGFDREKDVIFSKLKPKLEKLCRTHNKDFEIVDITDLNGLQHYTTKSFYSPGLLKGERNCLQIKLVLLGNETGPDILPQTIPSREFNQLLSSAKQLTDQPSFILKTLKDAKLAKSESSSETLLKFEKGLDFLVEYYVRDCNAVPAEYVFTVPQRKDVNLEEDLVILSQMQTVLKLAALNSSDLSESRKSAYFASDLAVNVKACMDAENTMVLVKQSKNVSNESAALLKQIQTTVKSENVHISHKSRKESSNAEFKNVLLKIENLVKANIKQSSTGVLYSDNLQLKTEKQLQLQHEICQNKLKFGNDSNGSLENIHSAFLREKQVFIFSGLTGSGRPTSTLLAKVADDFREWFPRDPVVATVLLSTSHFTSTIHGVALFLLCQICTQNQLRFPDAKTVNDMSEIVKLLESHLQETKKPTLIAIDSMNSALFLELFEQCHWLKEISNKNVKVILSSSKLLDFVSEIESYEVIKVGNMDRSFAVNLLTSLNLESHRTVSATQRDKLFLAFQKIPSYLYLKLLAMESRDWKSWNKTENIKIPTTIEELVNKICENIERKFGFAFAWNVLAYLSISRFGLSMSELSALIHSDTEIRNKIEKTCPFVSGRTSDISLSLREIIKYLDILLSIQTTDDKTVYSYTHDSIKESIKKRYFETLKSKSFYKAKSMHKNLAVMFMSSCATDSTNNKRNTHKFMINHKFCDVRSLHELPYHLVKANDTKSYKAILCNADWIIAKLQQLGPMELINDINNITKTSDLGFKFIRETILSTTELWDVSEKHHLRSSADRHQGQPGHPDHPDRVPLSILERLIDVSGDFSETVGILVQGLKNFVYLQHHPLLFPVLRTKPPFPTSVKFLSYNDKQNMLLCGDDSGKIAVKQLGQEPWKIIEYRLNGNVKNIHFSEVKNLAIIVSNSVQVIHVDSGREILHAPPKSVSLKPQNAEAGSPNVIHSEYVECVVSDDGRYLAALEVFRGYSAILHIWSIADGEMVTYEYNPFPGSNSEENSKLRVLSKRFVVFSMYSRGSQDGKGHYKMYMVRFDMVKHRRKIVESAMVRENDSIYLTDEGDRLAVLSADLQQKMTIKIYDVLSGKMLKSTKTELYYSQDTHVEFTSASMLLICGGVVYQYNWLTEDFVSKIDNDVVFRNLADVPYKCKRLLQSFSSYNNDDDICYTASANSNIVFVCSSLDSVITFLLPNASLHEKLGNEKTSFISTMENLIGISSKISVADGKTKTSPVIRTVKPDEIANAIARGGVSHFPLPQGMQRSHVSPSSSETSSTMTSSESQIETKLWKVTADGDTVVTESQTFDHSSDKQSTQSDGSHGDGESTSVSETESANQISESETETESESEMSGEYIIDESGNKTQAEATISETTISETNISEPNILVSGIVQGSADQMTTSPNIHVGQSMTYQTLDMPKLNTSFVRSSTGSDTEKESKMEEDTQDSDSSTDSDATDYDPDAFGIQKQNVAPVIPQIGVKFSEIAEKVAQVNIWDHGVKQENGVKTDNLKSAISEGTQNQNLDNADKLRKRGRESKNDNLAKRKDVRRIVEVPKEITREATVKEWDVAGKPQQNGDGNFRDQAQKENVVLAKSEKEKKDQRKENGDASEFKQPSFETEQFDVHKEHAPRRIERLKNYFNEDDSSDISKVSSREDLNEVFQEKIQYKDFDDNKNETGDVERPKTSRGKITSHSDEPVKFDREKKEKTRNPVSIVIDGPSDNSDFEDKDDQNTRKDKNEESGNVVDESKYKKGRKFSFKFGEDTKIVRANDKTTEEDDKLIDKDVKIIQSNQTAEQTDQSDDLKMTEKRKESLFNYFPSSDENSN